MPLADLNGTVVEQILSSTHPDGQWYDQSHDEFVLVVEGAATLELEGETVRLVVGDWLMLPAHTRHRVVATHAGTSWLAVHAAAPPGIDR
jgi:cupin 2 domain-containing protein